MTLLLTCLSLSHSALAQIPAEGPVYTTGELRYIGSAENNFPVDAEGTSLGQGLWLDQRLRAGVGARLGQRWQLSTIWDLGTGQVAGDTWDIEGSVDARRRGERSAFTTAGARPRRAALAYGSDHLQLEAGLVTSHWGLGLLANNGESDPLFGRADFGDRVVRLRATGITSGDNTPRRLFLTAAADLVIDDEIASVSDGQTAVQGIVSALLVEGEQRLGAYLVGRSQDEAEPGRHTDAGVLDLFATRVIPVGSAGFLHFAGESAGLLGVTSRTTTYNARDRIGVASLGATAEVGYTPKDGLLGGLLRAGYASGDADPDDGVTHDFTADRDFGVGMVLFDELSGAVEAASYALLTDPQYAGQGPDGADAIVTEGAFRRAAFLQPVARLREGPLDVSLGLLAAFATAPMSEPFYSYRAGGVPYSHHDTPLEGRLLGTELDWRIALQTTEDGPIRAQVELEGGHLALSESLRGPGPALVHLVTLTGRIRW